MWTDALLAILHHVAVFTLEGLLVVEVLLLATPLTERALARLGRVDALYGLAAIAVVAAGLARVFAGAKGAAFYGANPWFWLKLAIFAAIGAMSIVPTIRFIRWRRAGRLPSADEQRATCRWAVAQLAAFATMPVVAALMARAPGL
ncbi:MAG: DUF2214 family protein [Burkholderiales bacterium]|jgi:putative membrane protein|nr:DUF2214 family protein [Burkholderiales bacterium]